MPKKLERCVKKVMATGVSEKSARPICVKSTGLKPKREKGKRKSK